MAAVSFGSLVHESPTIFSLYDETLTKEGERESETKRACMCVNKESIIHARTSVIMGYG